MDRPAGNGGETVKRLTEAAEFWVADCGGDAAQALADVRETMAMLAPRDAVQFVGLEAELAAYLRGEIQAWADQRRTEGE